MTENYNDKHYDNIIMNQMSRAKYHEKLKDGTIEDGQWYITNDAFKDNVGGLDVLDIGQSLYIDETQGLRRWLNGSWVSINDNTRKFYERLMKASSLNPDLLCTPTEYDNIVINSAFHQCGKFAVDVANSRIRLPKIVYADGSLNISNIGNINSQRILIAKKEPTETDKSWFNYYSDGWLEQGNYAEHASSTDGSAQQFDVYLLKPYKDRNYIVQFSSGVGGSGWQYANGAMAGAGGSVMWGSWQYANHFRMCMPNGANNVYYTWRTSGYAKIPSDADITISRPLQYYYIQIATGVEQVVDITNLYQLNNPYTLGESKYSPIQLNNASWLRGGTTATRAEFPAYYDMLRSILNGDLTIEGISVKAVGDATIDRLDHVININTETFTLPTLNGTEDIPSKKPEDRIDYHSQVTVSPTTLTAPYNGWFRIGCEYQSEKSVHLYNATTDRNSVMSAGSSGDWIITEIWANKGDNVDVNYTATTNRFVNFCVATKPGILYFYVGDTIQNVNLINAGKIVDRL